MYGTCKFKGKEAAKYLAKQKLPENILDTLWTRDDALADKVAAAVLEWCRDHGARAPKTLCLLYTSPSPRDS